MAVNENVTAALKTAVAKAGQSDQIAIRLAAWLDALGKGNFSPDNSEEANKRIGDLLELVQLHGEEDFEKLQSGEEE